MPDTFHIVTEAPVGEYVAGQYVEFPPLLIDDFLPWCAELRAQWTRLGTARLNANPKMPAFDRWRAERHMEDTEPTLDHLQGLVTTIPGAKRVLLLSLAKAGRAKEEAAAVVASVMPYRVAGLAVEVSRLLPPPAAGVPGGGDGPNAGAGDNAGGSTGPT